MSRETRPYIDKSHPDVYATMLTAAGQAKKAAIAAGLPEATVELVNARVSQLNGCLTCLSVHVPAARRAGLEQRALDLLPAWRIADAFDDVQRAALRLAESLTLIDVAEDRDALGEELAHVLTTEQIAALEWVVVLINSFNRISIASGHPALRARA